MPVRSLNSSVLVWPDGEKVRQALEQWARAAADSHPELRKVGYIGSYARGDWGVGSDLDVVVVVDSSAAPFERRPAEWNLTSLPVPTDVLVYTLAEWDRITSGNTRFARVLSDEAVWVYP